MSSYSASPAFHSDSKKPALLAVGYQIFMGWVAANPELPAPGAGGESQAAD